MTDLVLKNYCVVNEIVQTQKIKLNLHITVLISNIKLIVIPV